VAGTVCGKVTLTEKGGRPASDLSPAPPASARAARV